MPRAAPQVLAGIILGISGLTAPNVALAGQEHLTLRTDLMLYGDNTEFRNPFREGETIFGAAVRPAIDIGVNRAVTVTLGAVGNHRFGGDDAFELVRPVVAIEFRGRSSSFLLGTLPFPDARSRPGPDRGGLHGLLPPLQRETLTFERPYEAGLQWTTNLAAYRHEAWLNWQRLNTASHRERFDAGVAGTIANGRRFSLPFQLHIVHEGGQLFAAGPVADSLAAALGGMISGGARGASLALEGYAVASRYVPDRERPERSRSGAGFFGRAALTARGWRGHLIAWRGDDYVKDEGDASYRSMRRDGSRYRGIRDYAELGLTRTFRPAPTIAFEASGRLHRTERHYEYSFRILSTARLTWRLRQSAPATSAAGM
jgi:hypothetical protein